MGEYVRERNKIGDIYREFIFGSFRKLICQVHIKTPHLFTNCIIQKLPDRVLCVGYNGTFKQKIINNLDDGNYNID